MDRYPHPPSVIAATVVCVVSLTKIFERKDVPPAFNPPVVEVIEIDEGFYLEDDAVDYNGTVSTIAYTSNSLSAKTLLLVAMSALILLFSGFCVRKIWQRMSIRTRLPRLRSTVLAFLLATLSSLAVYAATQWDTMSDRCSDRYITTYLLLAAFLSLTWNIVKHRVQIAHRRFYNIIVWAVLVVLLCLALWKMRIAQTQEYCQYTSNSKFYLLPFLLIMAFQAVKKLVPYLRRWSVMVYITVLLLCLLFSTLWALSVRQNQMCCQDACDSTLPFIPIVLLLAVWIVRKLWVQTPHLRIWTTMLSMILACLILRILWIKGHYWGPCEFMGYFAPVLLLLASMAVRKLSVQVHHRRFWNIILCIALAALLLLGFWATKIAEGRAICCDSSSLTIYVVPLLLLFASWAVKHLQTRTPPGWFHKMTLYLILAFLLILAVWAMKTVWNQACCCTCDFQEYVLPFLLLVSLWALKKICTWAPRHRISHIIRISTLLFVLLLVLWLLLKIQTQTLSCCLWDQALHLTLILSSFFASWPTPEMRIQTHHQFPGSGTLMTWLPVHIIIIAFHHTDFEVQTLVVNTLRRFVGFVVVIVALPVLLITLPVNHLRYLMRPIEPATETRAAPPMVAPTEDQANPGYQSEIRRLRTIIKFLVALFRVSKLKSSAEIARLQKATAQASENTAKEITRLTRRYDELVESTREALDPTGIYGHGQSLIYIIQRVRDRIARQMSELKQKEAALQDSSAMRAAEEARKSAEATTASLKDQLQTQASAHKVEMTRVQSALDAKAAEVEELSKAKTDAVIACQAEKDMLAKSLDNMRAAQQSDADGMSHIKGQLTSVESKLQEAVTKSQRLNTAVEQMKTAQRSHAKDMGHMKTQLADTNFKLQEAVRKGQEMEAAMNERSSQLESTDSELAAFKEQYESLMKSEELSKSERESAEAKTTSLESDISKLNQEVEGLKLHLSNATSAAADKDDQIRTLKEQVAAFTAQAVGQPPHAAGEISIDSNTEASSNAAVHISALNGALEEERARAQSLASQVQYLQHLQQQQQEYFQHSETRVQGLSQELGVANGKVAELTQKLNSGSLQFDDLGATLRSAEQKLSHLENYRRDADAELRRQEQKIEASQGETRRAREMCNTQRQELNVLRSNVKTLESELHKKQLAVKVVGREHSALDYEALYADRERAQELLDEIAVEGCDDAAMEVLEGLSIANSTLITVSAELHAMADGCINDKAWLAIHEKLSQAVIDVGYISMLSVDDVHPELVKQARAANARVERLMAVVEGKEKASRKNHALAVMVLPRGDEKADAPSSSADQTSDGTSKKRRSDDGTHSTPTTGEPSNLTQYGQPTEVSMPTQHPPVTSSFQFGTAVEAREPFVFGSTARPIRPVQEAHNDQGSNSVLPILPSQTPAAGPPPARSPEFDSTKVDSALIALQDDGPSSTKPASGAQASTFEMPSGFQLDPNHDFGFSFERPAAVTQEPLPEQRIFDLPPADAETASHPPQRSNSEDPAEVAEEQRTQEVLRRKAEIDAQDEDAEPNAHPAPTTFSDDDEFFANLQQRLDDNNDPALNVDVDWSNGDFNKLDFNEFDFSDFPDTGSSYGNHVPDDWNPDHGRGDYDILWDHDPPGRTAPELEPEAEWPPPHLSAEEKEEIWARVDAIAQYDPVDWNSTDQQPQGPFDSAQAGPSSSHSHPPQSRKRSRLED